MSASLLAALAVRSLITLIMARPQSQKPRSPKNAVSTADGAVTTPGGNGNTKPVAQFQQSTFSGPMPPPSVLEGYERLVHGAAERILAMAESDAKHQQEIEFAALRAAEAEIKRGQLFGFVIGLTALGASMLALAMGLSRCCRSHRRYYGRRPCLCLHSRSLRKVRLVAHRPYLPPNPAVNRTLRR